MPSRLCVLALSLLLLASACTLRSAGNTTEYIGAAQVTSLTPSETLPSSTPLATLTPSQTLRPPPTFEPPTRTVEPSLTPSITPTPTLNLGAPIEGLRGAETPTPSTTPGCQPRKDWPLVYTVQREDALAKIAQYYNTTVNELVAANCLTDANVISVGQALRVPGAAHPVQPEVECVEWEVQTPLNGSTNVLGEGTLTFNWRGPRAFRNLIRVVRSDGSVVLERVVELRQNETIDLYEDFKEGGVFTWYVYPLDFNFAQIPCKEGGPWTFAKAPAPTETPTPTDPPQPSGGLMQP